MNIRDLAAWCRISFENGYGNPLYYAKHLFVNGTETKDLVIPDSVTVLKFWTFYGFSEMTSVTIPNSVSRIEGTAFSKCNALAAVNIQDLAAWCGISFGNALGNPLYYAKHLFVNGTEIKDLVIPDGVTALEFGTFYGFTKMTSVTIPNSVTNIGKSAFCNCTGLTSVVIPDSVATIREYAFYNCSGLTTLTIPPSVTSIGHKALSLCSGLKTLIVPVSWKGTDKLEEASVPSRCTVIYGEPFSVRLTGLETNNIDVGMEVVVRAEAVCASGSVAYAWRGDAPGVAEGDTFRIDTSRAGGPYTLTCTVTDEIGGEAQASMEFRIVHAEPLSIQLTGLGTSGLAR